MPTLAFGLGGELGGDEVIAPAGLAAGVDHVSAALDRLPAQFRTKPRIRAMLTAFANPAVGIETALQQLATMRTIDNAIGINLDYLGRIVGQPRGGLDDETYRLYIRARIATNRSRGTVEDLLRIANLILRDDGVKITIETIGPAFVQVRITGDDIADATATVVINFLRSAVSAGVRMNLVTSPQDAVAFTTAGVLFNTGSDTGVFTIRASTTGGAGVTSYTAAQMLADWPASGQLWINAGAGDAQIVAYTSRAVDLVADATGQTLVFQLAAMQAGHPAGCQVELRTSPALGWGDASEPGQPNITPYNDAGTIGGRMTDVRE